MTENFEYIWGIFYEFIASIINGLNNVLITNGLTDLKTYTINLSLFSETPIFTVDLFTVLIWVGITAFAFFIYKLMERIIKLPFRFFIR